MCDRCASLEDEVAYLRERLGDRLDADFVRVLTKTFGLTHYEARLVAILFQSRTTVRQADIETAIRGDRGPYADPYSLSVFVSRIRAKIGEDFVVTLYGQGFALSDKARRAIAAAFAADVDARTDPGPVTVTPLKKNWTPAMVGQLAQLRRRGLSFAECARVFHASRNAVIGAAWRYLNDGEPA